MRFTTINSLINITDDDILKKINKGETNIDLTISPYIEEESASEHITLLISSNVDDFSDCDIYLDLDILEAKKLIYKMHHLLLNRERFIESKNNRGFYCRNKSFVKNYYGEYCKKQCEECNLKSKK